MSSQSSAAIGFQPLYERPARELLAALRALRTAPGPESQSEARLLRAATSRIGRTVVEVHDGQILLGWDADAEGVWGGDGMEAIRSVRPAQPRLLRALAACLKCCWTDPDAPIYPAGSARIDDVLAAAVSMRAPMDAGDANYGGTWHAQGALTTLDFSGLIVLNRREQTLTLGPVIATWPERDVMVLRGLWPRLPQPPAGRPFKMRGSPAEAS